MTDVGENPYRQVISQRVRLNSEISIFRARNVGIHRTDVKLNFNSFPVEIGSGPATEKSPGPELEVSQIQPAYGVVIAFDTADTCEVPFALMATTTNR